jgi:hypothetical protein
MEQIAYHYPVINTRPFNDTYEPGSLRFKKLGTTRFYGPLGDHGISAIAKTTPIKQINGNGYVSQRGPCSYYYKIPRGQQLTAQQVERIPIGGSVMRVVGSAGDDSSPPDLPRSGDVGGNDAGSNGNGVGGGGGSIDANTTGPTMDRPEMNPTQKMPIGISQPPPPPAPEPTPLAMPVAKIEPQMAPHAVSEPYSPMEIDRVLTKVNERLLGAASQNEDNIWAANKKLIAYIGAGQSEVQQPNDDAGGNLSQAVTAIDNNFDNLQRQSSSTMTSAMIERKKKLAQIRAGKRRSSDTMQSAFPKVHIHHVSKVIAHAVKVIHEGEDEINHTHKLRIVEAHKRILDIHQENSIPHEDVLQSVGKEVAHMMSHPISDLAKSKAELRASRRAELKASGPARMKSLRPGRKKTTYSK